MRIAIYGINYAPELTGIGKYTGEMGAWLASQGHTVHAFTAMPYYPEWKIHEKYKGKLWHTEMIEGVKVYRCPLYVPRKVTSMKRIIHEMTFLLGILPVWFLTLFQKKYDLTICISPPFHLGFLPMIYSKLRRNSLITHIQDLQVDAAKNLVMIKNGPLLNMMFGAEKFILKRSTAISTISKGMMKRIVQKNIPDIKTFLFPNWADVNFIRPLTKEKSMRRELGLSDDAKIILYSGNLGEKQGLDIIIDVAKGFQSRKDVHFLIVGSGGNKENLQNQVSQNHLDNVHFHPLASYEKLPSLLAAADVHLVLQKKSASDLVMPSKLSGILSAGGCAVVTASSGTSLYELVDKNQLGILVEPESAEALKAGLENALSSNLDIYRSNARRYAVNNLSKESVMHKFQEQLFKLQSPAVDVIYKAVSS